MPHPDATKVPLRADRFLHCGACDHDEFVPRNWRLVAESTAFVVSSPLAGSADCYVCTACGHIEWFDRRVLEKHTDEIAPFTRQPRTQ